jgi:hypothetical protein
MPELLTFQVKVGPSTSACYQIDKFMHLFGELVGSVVGAVACWCCVHEEYQVPNIET